MISGAPWKILIILVNHDVFFFGRCHFICSFSYEEYQCKALYLVVSALRLIDSARTQKSFKYPRKTGQRIFVETFKSPRTNIRQENGKRDRWNPNTKHIETGFCSNDQIIWLLMTCATRWTLRSTLRSRAGPDSGCVRMCERFLLRMSNKRCAQPVSERPDEMCVLCVSSSTFQGYSFVWEGIHGGHFRIVDCARQSRIWTGYAPMMCWSTASITIIVVIIISKVVVVACVKRGWTCADRADRWNKSRAVHVESAQRRFPHAGPQYSVCTRGVCVTKMCVVGRRRSYETGFRTNLAHPMTDARRTDCIWFSTVFHAMCV